MAFVPSFRHDVFVSYAHADDEPSAGAARGFVSQLVNDLQIELARKTDKNRLDIWWDAYKLKGNTTVTPEIEAAASQSACIVIVLSSAYLRSDWCARERSRFLSALEGRRDGSVFLVDMDQVPLTERPPAVGDLRGYPFWCRPDAGYAARPLRVDLPSDRPDYINRYTDLANDIANHLRQAGQPLAKASAADACVALAGVTDDLVHRRQEVKTYLEQLGFEVLPARPYARSDPVLHRQQIHEDLARAKAFVQLLGPYPGDTSEYERGLPWFRFEAARSSGVDIPMLQWRDPALDLATVEDDPTRTLLTGPEVRCCGLEEFKQEIASVARRKEKPKPAVSGGLKSVFVNADKEDRPFAREVQEWLLDQGCVVLDLGESADVGDARETWQTYLEECDSLMLVYGSAPSRWVTTQFLQSAKVLAQRDRPPDVLSICVAPSGDRPDKAAALPAYRNMHVVRCESGLNPRELDQFLARLGVCRAAA
jgi:hypothetical protein